MASTKTVSLFVKSRPIGHYALSLFSLMFHSGEENLDIQLVGIGQATRRILNLANGMEKSFSPKRIKVKSLKLDTYKPDSNLLSKLYVEMHYPSSNTLSAENSKERKNKFFNKVKNMWDEPQEMSICELEFILSTLLSKNCSLILSCPDYMKISEKGLKKTLGKEFSFGSLKIENEELMYNPADTHSNKTVENNRVVRTWVESALLRMGFLAKKTFKKFAEELSRDDDVLIGLDTNNFYKATVTAGLLDSLVGVTHMDFLDLPNWITFVASEVSVSELENRATGGDKGKEKSEKIDWLLEDDEQKRYQRQACRGLEEFMEIEGCKDLEGVTLLLTGDIPSGIDLSANTNTKRDETIRKQIRSFFQTVNFHKGVCFVTGDKINAMFAETEGLKAYYTKGDNLETAEKINFTKLQSEDDINNVSELIYELGIEVPLKITCKCSDSNIDDLVFTVNTNWADKLLEAWENRILKVKVGFNEEALKKINKKLKDKEKEIVEMRSNEKPRKKGGRLENEKKERDDLETAKKIIQETNARMRDKKTAILKILEKNADSVALDDILIGWKEINGMHHRSLEH